MCNKTPEICPYAGSICSQYCALKKELSFQASEGASNGKGSVGPYWRRDSWDSYASRVVLTAEQVGCLESLGMNNFVDRLTTIKNNNGEFLR